MGKGVYPRKSALERFNESHVVLSSGCWKWTKADRGNGYGVVWYRGKNVPAHRLALLLYRGVPLKTDLVADHLCRNTMCVNPEHLEMVSTRINNLRGESPYAKNAAKTHCENGHEFSPNNTYLYLGRRNCKICRIANAKAFNKRRGVRARSEITHCPKGHEYTKENTYICKRNKRMCRECGRLRNQKYNALMREKRNDHKPVGFGN